jgi:zinc ribbon protein
MVCPRCGAPVAPGQPQCMNCGLPLVRVSTRRPAVVTFLAILYFLGGLSMAAAAIYAANIGRKTEFLMASGVGIGIAIAAILYAVMTYGMIAMKSWARVLQIIFCFLMLPAIPFGTILGIVLLIYFWKPALRALFSGRPYEQFTQEEVASLQQVQSSSGAGIILTICAIIVLNIAGTFAFLMLMPKYMPAMQLPMH